MSLIQQIDTDIKNAMKSREADKLSALRMLKAACTHEAIQKKKNELDDNEIMTVIQKQAKQRKESIESFKSAGRNEQAAKEEQELVILSAYLPKQLSEDELKTLIKEVIAKVNASTKADLGKVMKELTPLTKGKADGKLVTDLVSKSLA